MASCEGNLYEVSDFMVIAGCGISASVQGKTVLAGKADFMQSEGVDIQVAGEQTARCFDNGATVIYLALDGNLKGFVALADTIREDQKHYGRLFSGESAELFWDYFRRWFEKELGEEICDKLKTKKITVPEDLFTGLYIGTFIETVKWWFGDGCEETPEQVERYFEEVF